MDAHLNRLRLLRAAAVVMLSLAMVCGLLILLNRAAMPAAAAPLALTIVNADITADDTWTTLGSPYIVSTDTVAVRNGAKLTIEPGVEVRFVTGAQLQMRDGGQLEAIGTSGQPITFTSDLLTPGRGDWSSIRFDATALTGTIQYAVIEYAQVGVELNRPGQYYNVSSNTLRYIGDYDGDPTDSGAIIGVPDGSDFSYNTVYSSEVGIRLNKAFGNLFQDNHIYDIDADCIALLSAGAGSPGGGGNQFFDNQLHTCRANGIRLEGDTLGGVGNNQVIGNLIWDTYNEGVYVTNQSSFAFKSNTVYGTAITTTTGTGGFGSNLGAAALFDIDGIDAQDNYLHSNGVPGSASYAGALYIQDAGGLGAMVITGTRVRDSNGSGLVFDGTNSPSSHTINNNAICVDPRYEVENRDGALTASGNWLGTNSPVAGTEYTGTVTISPTIQLGITAADSSILANGTATTTLTITFNDGASHVVPPEAREISVATSAGTLSDNTVTVDSSGQASVVLTSASTMTTAVVTATEWCGYAVTDIVTFAGVDLSVSKTASPPPYGAGHLITYTISYRNNGNTTATGVVLTETLPTSTTFVGPPGWTQVGSTNQYTLNVGEVSPLSGTLTTTLVVSISESLPAGSAVFTNVVEIGDDGASGADRQPDDNVYTLTVSGGNLPDLWVVKNDNVGSTGLSGSMVGALANTEGGPGILQLIHTLDSFSSQAVPEGGLITYTIGFGNSSRGTAPATGVVLSETLPLYTSYAGPACGEPEGWCQVGSTRTYTRYIGGLDPIDGDYVYFWVRVDSSLPPTVTEVINQVCIYGNEDDLIPDNNCSTEETDVITGTYDLSVTKVENTICPNPGDALQYRITVQNQGANNATNAILREILPANTTEINPPGSGWTNAGGGVYTYSLGLVASGTIRTADFWVQINPGLAPSVETITNVVSVQADGTDSDTGNNTFTLVTPIGTTPDLAITKNDNILDEVDPGGVISYTIIYVNNSHRFTATNVIITDTLPLGTVITGASASLWTQVGSSRDYTYVPSGGDLGPNEAGSVELMVQLTDPISYPYGSEVVNRVEIGGDEDECNTTNNVATEETPVQGADAADLEVSKTDNVPFCAVPGDVVEYSISYLNNSYTISATNVLLTELIDTNAVEFLGPLEWTDIGGGEYTRAPVPTTVGPREDGTFDFDVQIAQSIPDGQEYITNVVRIETSTTDWDLTNNVYTLTTYVPEWPDLIVVKNDNVGSTGLSALGGEMDYLLSRLQFSPQAWARLQSSLDSGQIGAAAESVDPGDTITYTIILGNIGRATSTGVVITETLPAGTSFVAPGYWQHVGGDQYVYSLASDLERDHGDVLEFIVRVDDPFLAGSRVINTVQIGGNEQECDTSNNSSTDETPVAGAQLAHSTYLPIIFKGYPEVPPTPTPTPTPTPEPKPTPPVPNQDSHVADLVVDPQSHYVYVASPRDDKVHFIHVSDVNTYTHEYINDIVVSDGPTGLGVLPSTTPSRVFVAHAFDWEGGLRAFEVPAGPANLVETQNRYMGAAPVKLAINPALNRAYVSNYYDRLAVVDTLSNQRVALNDGWVGQKNYVGGWSIDVSTNTNRAYLATRDTGELVAFDGSGDRLLQDGYIPTHFKPPQPCSLYTVAVNENTDHIFVPCPARKEIFVHVESEFDIFAEQERGRLELREDGWVRVMAPGDVNWLDALSLAAYGVSDWSGVWGITVDEATNRVFITDPVNDLVIVVQDGTTPAVHSVLSNANHPGAEFDEPQGIDVDSERGRLFVANAGNDTVTVLEATAPFTVVTTIDLGGP